MEANENNFILQMKKRNQAALEFAVKKFGGLIKKITYEILYDYPSDAEECVYDTILKIWEHIGEYNGSAAAFAGWAAKIARYTSLDRLRKIKKLIPAADIDEISVADTNLTGDELFDGFFNELISCLNKEDRELFIRIFWNGDSIDEASKATGKSKGVLYNRISRGKRKIIQNNPQYFRKENQQ